MDRIVNITPLDGSNINEYQSYSSEDLNLLPYTSKNIIFDPNTDIVEFTIYDSVSNVVGYEEFYSNYSITNNQIVVDPEKDLERFSFTEGIYTVKYNFLSNLLESSPYSKFFITEISPDRTEIRLDSTTIPNNILSLLTEGLSESIRTTTNSNAYPVFYLNFGQDRLVIATNVLLDDSDSNNSTVLIKLYEPLPSEFNLKSELWLARKIADSIAYQVDIQTTFNFDDEINEFGLKLRGPNLNLNINDQINNSTEFVNYNSLFSNISTLGTGSLKYQLDSLLAEKGIEINVDYSDYSNFVHFSSAKTRLENFILKLALIEQYQYNNKLPEGATTNNYISQSQNLWLDKINSIITNFDGYEYYLYYESGSTAWPKSNSTYPYNNVLTTDTTAISSWLSSQLTIAEKYDSENKDYLLNSIPIYLIDDGSNNKMKLFVEMLGQHFDNVWIYIKDITNKYNADNRLDYGVSKDLVADILRDFGIKIYQNNFSTNDLYSSLLGITPSGSLYNISNASTILPTSEGYEYIDTFVTASATGSLFPIEDLNKEIYKRIYHNLPYLLKKKGTLEGLRTLVTIYGVPDTLLRIVEYGGKDKTNVNDWDYWYNYFSYAFDTKQQAQPLIPWLPLLRNYYNSEQAILPDTITLRFKTNGIPDTPITSQSIFVKKSNNVDTEFDFGVFLFYTGSGYLSSSYSGSIPDEYNQYGNLRFTLKRDGLPSYTSSADIYLPFFDGGWWSVMLKRDKHLAVGDDLQTVTYSLYAKNKIYNGVDGYEIGFQGSSSITIDGPNEPSWNTSWNNFSYYALPFVPFGVYMGGYINGVTQNGDIIVPSNTIFSGSFQEFRYYGNPINEITFDDYVMNPKSIEGNTTQGSGSSKDLVDFRAPLGNLLEQTYYSTNPYETYISLHPAITGSCITESFWNNINDIITNAAEYASAEYALLPNTFYFYGDPGGTVITAPDSHSNYDILYHTPGLTHTVSQTEVYYVDTPIVGLSTPNSNKIKDANSSFYGEVLSSVSSLQQNYEASQSYTKDINYLEVGFSPQNEINDDIAESLGYFDIGKYIGDPQYRFTTNNTYPDLNKLRDEYFCKYIHPYNLNDYVRLIKYFDNSLFKLIKDFVPARTSLASGLIIKPHFLERNRYQVPSVEWEKQELTASIDTAFISGGIAGGFSEFAGENPFIRNYIPDFTQSWQETIVTPLGLTTQSHTTQDEFYNGEFSGSIIQMYEEQINPFLDVSTKENLYTVTQYIGKKYKNYSAGPLPKQNGYFIVDEIIFEEKFLNPNTEPNQGEIYLFNESIDATPVQSFPNFNPTQYKNKFVKISKFNSSGDNLATSLEQATQLNILMKNGSGITNVSFPIQQITEYPTYYLYTIADPELSSILSVPIYGTLYNLSLLFLQSPTIPVNVYNNDNEIRNGDALAIGNANFIPLSALSINRIAQNQGYQFTPTINFDGFGYGNFNTSDFSYVFEKTPNVNDINIIIAGNIINTGAGTRTISLLRKNTNQLLLESEVLDSTVLTSAGFQNFFLFATLSDSSLPVENDELFLTISATNAGSVTNLNITQFEIDYKTAAQSNTPPDLIAIEPGFEIDFVNNDYNALLGNTFEIRKSQYYMDVDYSTSPTIGSSLTPINFNQLIDGIATRAQVQDYYYNLQRHTLPRYDGSRTTAAKFNEYTDGDTGYGKEIVAGNLKPFVGYYTSKGGSTPEVLKKTIINLDYIIDEDINTQVPALSDFTYNNQVQLFERDGYLYLDPDKNSALEQFAGNNKYKIYRSGEYATPILYSQTGSSTGFIPVLSFAPPGETPVGPYFTGKYNVNQTSNTLKDSLYRRNTNNSFSSQGRYGYNNFPYNSAYGGVNDNPIDNPNFPPLSGGGNSLQYPHTWNQIPLDHTQIIYQDAGLILRSPYPTGLNNNLPTSPMNRGRIDLANPVQFPNYSFKAKFTVTIKWNPQQFSTDPTNGLSPNFGIDQTNYSQYNVNNNTPLKVGFRIRGTATGWDFLDLTPEPGTPGGPSYEYIQKGTVRTITIETPIIPPEQIGVGGYIFVQGIAFFGDNDYLDSLITGNSINNFTIASNRRLSFYNDGVTITNPTLEIIQIPEPNIIEIDYSNGPYITAVANSLDNTTPEGDSSLAFVVFTSSFSNVWGKIFPQITNSGYDSTIYPFQLPEDYEASNTFSLLYGGATSLGSISFFPLPPPNQPLLLPPSPPPPGTFDYEIRFNADENQSYPIAGYYYNEDDNALIFIIVRPRTAILTSNTSNAILGIPNGPVPIENYQSFLIRRWIPRAGYIYLDVDAPLGRGIVKPEFITKDIQDKIPEIVKDLTDKGLIQ